MHKQNIFWILKSKKHTQSIETQKRKTDFLLNLQLKKSLNFNHLKISVIGVKTHFQFKKQSLIKSMALTKKFFLLR